MSIFFWLLRNCHKILSSMIYNSKSGRNYFPIWIWLKSSFNLVNWNIFGGSMFFKELCQIKSPMLNYRRIITENHRFSNFLSEVKFWLGPIKVPILHVFEYFENEIFPAILEMVISNEYNLFFSWVFLKEFLESFILDIFHRDIEVGHHNYSFVQWFSIFSYHRVVDV